MQEPAKERSSGAFGFSLKDFQVLAEIAARLDRKSEGEDK
jgi:hypothetical protein